MMRLFFQQLPWLAFSTLVVFFILFAQVDLSISHYFYDPSAKKWLWNDSFFIQAMYEFFRYIPYLIVPVLLCLCVWTFKRFGRKTQPFRVALFLLLSLVIGPGLLVHQVFKEGFDRPRPRQIQEFGGDKVFSPAFIITDTCGVKGCASFQSGHAAMGFWFMAFAWVWRKRWLLVLGIGLGALAAFGRIVQGGHFLSDTIFAGFTCYFVCRYLSLFLLGYAEVSAQPLWHSIRDGLGLAMRWVFFGRKPIANR